jgi:hypothetical protein
MRLANMATGHRHEARENDERLYGSGSAMKHDEEEAKERWYDNVDEDIKYLYEAGENESSTAQRTPHPGYSKLETKSFQHLDWRGHQAIVSPFPLHCTYTMPCPFH